MSGKMPGNYTIRSVGTSCCNPSINKGKMEKILNEMQQQGYTYVDLYIDVTYKILIICPERAAIMIFKQ